MFVVIARRTKSDVAISTNNQKSEEIPTPVCALARNDMEILGVLKTHRQGAARFGLSPEVKS